MQVSEGLAALSVSALVCYTAAWLARSWGASGQAITFITAISVALATLLPGRLAPLVPSAEGLAQILMQVRHVRRVVRRVVPWSGRAVVVVLFG